MADCHTCTGVHAMSRTDCPFFLRRCLQTSPAAAAAAAASAAASWTASCRPCSTRLRAACAPGRGSSGTCGGSRSSAGGCASTSRGSPGCTTSSGNSSCCCRAAAATGCPGRSCRRRRPRGKSAMQSLTQQVWTGC